MISNLSDLTKRTSRFGERYNVAVPVMRQQNPLLGNNEYERATNAKSLFHQPSPFGDYNEIMKRGREDASKREEIEQKEVTILNKRRKQGEYYQNYDNKIKNKVLVAERERKQYNNRQVARKEREREQVFLLSNLFTEPEVFQQSSPSKGREVFGGDVFGDDVFDDEEEEAKEDQRPNKLDTDLGAGVGAGAGVDDADSNFYDYPLDVQKLLSSGKGTITLDGKEIPITAVTEGGEDGLYILKGSFGKSGKRNGVKAMKYWQGKWMVIGTLSKKEIWDLVPPPPKRKETQTVTIPPPPSKGKSSSGKGKGKGK
jgi:hypothetical protein